MLPVTYIVMDSKLTASVICESLQKSGNPEKAQILCRFFKTGPGEYGEGDSFVGITVPEIRNLVKKYQALPLAQIQGLLRSTMHEARLLALLILVHIYENGDKALREKVFKFYLRNTQRINNWDLVDASAPYIIGPHLKDRDRSPLYKLALSPLLWERRIAILATFHFIKTGEYEETLQLAEKLIGDKEDLIHKAVGWMLREIGKRNLQAEEDFLKIHYRTMPRTMLRYAIEKFPEPLRRQYLQGQVG